MKFIKMIIDFFKNLFGVKNKVETPPPNDGHVFIAPTTGIYEISYKTYPEEEKKEEEVKKPKISFAKAMKEHHDEERSKLSDGVLLIRYNTIKAQILRGDRSDDVILEYINELEYRGLKYEEIIWSNTDRFSKIIKY